MSKNHLPNLALRFLRWFCPGHLLEEIEGDLVEKYESELKIFGGQKARRRFTWNVVRFFRPGIVLRNRFSLELNQGYMYRNYFKVMLRNMLKRKMNSAITVSGLTVGITFSLMIGVFVWQELQVNKQLQDVDRLYIVERDVDSGGMGFFAPSPLGKLVAEQYPTKVESYFRFYDRNVKISKDDKHFIMQGIVGDSTFLKIFGLPVAYGDKNTALDQPYSVIVTEQLAQKFFNRTDVVGETLNLTSGTSDKRDFVITAVLKNLQRNSVTDLVGINAQFVIPLQTFRDFRLPDPDDWQSGEIITYLKLTSGTSPSEIEPLMSSLIEDNGTEQQKSNKHLSMLGLENYYLVTQNGKAQNMIFILAGIACFILLLAVINFINISIASASVRLKEIGVRKVIGGIRRQVMFQFLSESLIITFMAGSLSLLSYEFLRPVFDTLLNTPLVTIWSLDFDFWLWFAFLLVTIGFLAGAYPAFFMSSYHVIESLKGKLKESKKNFSFSRVLLTGQFLIAIFVFICSIVITKQVSYFLEKDLGYDKSFVLTVSSVPRIWSQEGLNQMESAKLEFLTSPAVEAVSLSWEIPNGNNGGDVQVYKYGSDETSAIKAPFLAVDEDYAEVYQLDVVSGKFFYSDGEDWQANSVVLNETASKILKADVGEKVKFKGGQNDFTVKGIISDFNFFSLRDPVKPTILFHTNENQFFRFFSIKLRPGNLSASVTEIEAKWKTIFPDDPFDYAFMDDQLAKLYKSEQQLKRASMAGTGIMLVIVLIGVLGLVALNVTRRTKEIGVRKALGASVKNILLLFSSDYIRMILIAFVVAVPSVFLLINRWLDGFAYRVELKWWMFTLPGVGLLILALVAVTIQATRAANVNPVKSLRTE